MHIGVRENERAERLLSAPINPMNFEWIKNSVGENMAQLFHDFSSEWERAMESSLTNRLRAVSNIFLSPKRVPYRLSTQKGRATPWRSQESARLDFFRVFSIAPIPSLLIRFDFLWRKTLYTFETIARSITLRNPTESTLSMGIMIFISVSRILNI